MPKDFPYSDILNLPHWNPRHHKRMTSSERAAQFAPFAALNGFSAAIENTEKQHLEKFEAKPQEQLLF